MYILKNWDYRRWYFNDIKEPREVIKCNRPLKLYNHCDSYYILYPLSMWVKYSTEKTDSQTARLGPEIINEYT